MYFDRNNSYYHTPDKQAHDGSSWSMNHGGSYSTVKCFHPIDNNAPSRIVQSPFKDKCNTFGGRKDFFPHGSPLAARKDAISPVVGGASSPRSLAELQSEDSSKFRQLPCRTFLSVGTCPYRERCVYLHDPRLMCRGAQIKSRKKNKEDIVIDSLFWPVLPAEAVHQRMDCNGQPHVVQRYSVPAPQNDKFRRHDQAVYSMWQHFVTACGLLNMNAGGGGDYRCEVDTLAYMHPAFIAKHPTVHRAASASPTQAYYDPANRMYHWNPTQETSTSDPLQVPPLVALLSEKEKTNAFVNTQRLDVFVTLSAGESIARCAHEDSALDSLAAASSCPPRPRKRIQTLHQAPTMQGYASHEMLSYALPCDPTRTQSQAQAHSQLRQYRAESPHTTTATRQQHACQEYMSLSDLAPNPTSAPAPASAFTGVLRPVAWSPPRDKVFVSSDDAAGTARTAAAAANEKDAGNQMDDDEELLAICGQLTRDPGPSPGPSFVPGMSASSAFRLVAMAAAPLALAAPKELSDLGSISSPTTVADAFRDSSPCMHIGKGFRFEGYEDVRSELDQQAKSSKQIEAYEHTTSRHQSSASASTTATAITPVRLFRESDETALSTFPVVEAGGRLLTAVGTWTPIALGDAGAGQWSTAALEKCVPFSP